MATAIASANLFDVLSERGLVAQTTDENIRRRFERPVTAYIGFDPTADSLHIGSLVPIMGLIHLVRCGHQPVVLIGGATGLVGDPSGKTEARRMLTPELVRSNGEAIFAQIRRILGKVAPPEQVKAVNNADWFEGMGWIEMLRQVGSRMSVNRMLTMESVKGRLGGEYSSSSSSSAGGGLSYLEFSYMLMQAYDFAHLYARHGCTIQMGGQDQWGNIVMGIELIRRLHGGGEIDGAAQAEAKAGRTQEALAAGLTFPLVTKADGGKFGKSEQGNVWLDPARTSPYAFFQFWRNVADADVGRFLRYFTLLPIDEIRELEALEGAAINEAKEKLAFAVTALVHDEEKANKALASARNAFGSEKDATGEAIPSATLSKTELAEGMDLRQLMVRANLAGSNGEAKRLIAAGGVRVHDQRVDEISRVIRPDDVRDGYILLRVGKKRLFRFDVE